jgi:hypothetical protein
MEADSNVLFSVPANHVCFCQRSFVTIGALNFHRRSCKKTNKRLSGALAKAKEVWKSKKRRRVEADSGDASTTGCNSSDSQGLASQDVAPSQISQPASENVEIMVHRIFYCYKLYS